MSSLNNYLETSVYVITPEKEEFVKIGKSYDPEKRCRQLEQEHGLKLKIVYATERHIIGSYLELSILAKLKAERIVRREFFALRTEVAVTLVSSEFRRLRNRYNELCDDKGRISIEESDQKFRAFIQKCALEGARQYLKEYKKLRTTMDEVNPSAVRKRKHGGRS